VILVDRDLKARAERMGIEPGHINPASVDLSLGGHIIEYRTPDPNIDMEWANELNGRSLTTEQMRDYQEQVLLHAERNEYDLEPGQAFLFRPGYFYLAHSAEEIRMPSDYAALLTLKSTTGRRGLEHLNAGWIDPDFVGQITLEFAPELPVLVRIGDRLVQLTYLECSSLPEKGYALTGRYQGQKKATPPRLT